ncbi:hypothetical protein [Kitasatospora sp. NPDC001095]
MRSRTVAGAVLLTVGLTGVGVGSAHAESATPAAAPYGAAAWGGTSQTGYGSGAADVDNEVHSGTAGNFGQEVTHSGAVGTGYDNNVAMSSTGGGAPTQYGTGAIGPGGYGSF